MNDNPNQQYNSYATRWSKCIDASAGQSAIHAGGEIYLPIVTGQSQEDYENYKKRASYFNAAGRTLDGLVGMLFRKPVEITAPAAMQDIINDIDLAGTPLEGLAMNIARNIISVGRIGCLVEYPRVTATPNSAAGAAALNLRPYVSTYMATSILDWKEARVNNMMHPVMVKLHEMYEIQVSEYEYKQEPQVRILLLRDGSYVQEIWRKTDKGGWQLIDEITPLLNNAPLDFIPFWMFGAKSNSFDIQQPPLEPLCDLNISHYMVNAVYENGCYISGNPIPMLAGFTVPENESIKLGRGGYASADPSAKWGFLEFTGQGLGALVDNLRLKEAQMASIGARFLAPDKAGVEASATLLMRSNGETSVLASMANLESQALQDMLEFIAQWAGIAGEIAVKISTDFLPVGMTSQDLDARLKAWQAGAIPKEELFKMLQRGEVLSDEITYDDYGLALDSEKETLTGIL